MVDDEIFYYFQLNTTQSVVVETDRKEVLENSKRIWKSILYIWQFKARGYQGFRLWNYAGMEKITKPYYIWWPHERVEIVWYVSFEFIFT